MSKEDWKENTIEKIFKKADLWPWKDGEIVSILDVACGLSLKSKYIPAQIRVGVDIYDKYFDHIESDVPYVVIKHDVRKLDEIFVPNSFDLVMAIDVLEHLEKEESLKLIKDCEKIARKGIMFETPEGFIPQDLDITGHGAHEQQTHRSSWEAKELEDLGYSVIKRDYKMSDAKRYSDDSVEIDPNVVFIDAIKVLGKK